MKAGAALRTLPLLFKNGAVSEHLGAHVLQHVLFDAFITRLLLIGLEVFALGGHLLSCQERILTKVDRELLLGQGGMRCADASAEAERIAFGVSDLSLGCCLAFPVLHSLPPFVTVITIRSSGVLSLKLVHLRVEAIKGVFGWLIVIVEVEVGFGPWRLG